MQLFQIGITSAFLVSLMVNILFSPPVLALKALDRAQLLLEEGRNNEAIAILEPLLQSKDEEELAQATELLYRIYYEKGDNQKAIQVLETYIQRFPQSPTSYLYLYWAAKLEEERQNVDRSIFLLQRLIDTYPTDPNFTDPYHLRCQAQEDIAHALQNYRKDYPGAIKAYEEVLSCIEQEEQPRIMMEIALCYEKMREITQAVKQYENVINQSQDEFYRRWAQLRIRYLTEKPQTAEKTPEALAQKLIQAFEKRDVKALEQLAKKGDFWTGVNFSEFEIDEFSRAREYLGQYMGSSPKLKINRNIQTKNTDLVLRLENWGDPDYDILYLVIDQGVYGWEWKGLILSSTILEEQPDAFHGTD